MQKSCLLFLQLTQSSRFIQPALSSLHSLCYNNTDNHKGTQVFHKQSRLKCNRLGLEKKIHWPNTTPMIMCTVAMFSLHHLVSLFHTGFLTIFIFLDNTFQATNCATEINNR